MKQFYLIAFACLSYLSCVSAGSIVILNTVINKTNTPVAIAKSSGNALNSEELFLIPQKTTTICALCLPVCQSCEGSEGSEAQKMEVLIRPLLNKGISSTILTLFFDRIAQWASLNTPSLMLSAGLQTDKASLHEWYTTDIKLQRDRQEVYFITLTLEGDDFSKSTFTVIPRST